MFIYSFFYKLILLSNEGLFIADYLSPLTNVLTNESDRKFWS